MFDKLLTDLLPANIEYTEDKPNILNLLSLINLNNYKLQM